MRTSAGGLSTFRGRRYPAPLFCRRRTGSPGMRTRRPEAVHQFISRARASLREATWRALRLGDDDLIVRAGLPGVAGCHAIPGRARVRHLESLLDCRHDLFGTAVMHDMAGIRPNVQPRAGDVMVEANRMPDIVDRFVARAGDDHHRRTDL